jgi:hypothetical protein
VELQELQVQVEQVDLQGHQELQVLDLIGKVDGFQEQLTS